MIENSLHAEHVQINSFLNFARYNNSALHDEKIYCDSIYYNLLAFIWRGTKSWHLVHVNSWRVYHCV